MSTKTNSKTSRVPSRASMTPEKYKALSPEMKRAYSKKAKAEMDAFDKKIEARQIETNQLLAKGLVEIIPLAPHIEWEIVSNYLDRKSKYLVDREETDRAFYAKYPQFDPKNQVKKQNKKMTATV